MALFHLSVTQTKRSAGQSAIASAAYRAGERLYSEYYGEYSDYTRKGGVICSDILLPSHAPPEYADRQTLWNAVEKAERGKNAQLAYSFDIALQNEFSLEENIALARQFLLENFVSRGMVVDFAVHQPDREDGGIPNPHFHVLCPIRPIEQNGKWGLKQRRVYELDEDGNRIRDANGKFVFNAVPTTDWGSPETLEHWRQTWAELCNAKFAEKGLDVRIDHRSYERQGVELLPTVHEGATVRAMEKKGIRTEKGEFNRWIKATNAVIRDIKKKIALLFDWIAEAKAELAKPQAPDLVSLLNAYYTQRKAGAYSQKGKISNLKEMNETFNYLRANGIYSLEDLESRVSEHSAATESLKKTLDEQTARMKAIKQLYDSSAAFQSLKPVYDGLQKIKFEKSILISCGARLAPFDIQELREVTAYDELELDTLGDRKTALFLIMSDTDDTFNFLISLVYTQLFNLLCEKADDVYGGRLPVHVRCLIDECANIGQIPKLEKLVATIRSREISACLVLQAQSQLKAIYKDNADTIIGNMDTSIFLGGKEPTTLKELAAALGKETVDTYNTGESRGRETSHSLNYQKLGRELMSQDELAVMDGGKCILQLRGVRPFLSNKYDITKHPNYKYTSDFDKKNALDMERFLSHRLRLKPDTVCEVFEANPSGSLPDKQ